MSQETFFNYKRYRWFWISLLLTAVMSGIYLIDRPLGGRNGGTVVGYTYGIIATLAIAWLMWFGIRKRSYRSRVSTVQGWLAAHVWLGISLLLIVPLHSGFQFHLNVHTLAYALMVLTILSGIWGAINYAALSKEIQAHRGGGREQVVLEQIDLLSKDIDRVLNNKSDAFLKMASSLDFTFRPKLSMLLFGKQFANIDQSKAASLIVTLPESEQEEAMKVIGLVDQKADLASSLIKDAKVKTLLRIWLFLHIPLSIALCAALTIHIVSVFYNW